MLKNKQKEYYSQKFTIFLAGFTERTRAKSSRLTRVPDRYFIRTKERVL